MIRRARIAALGLVAALLATAAVVVVSAGGGEPAPATSVTIGIRYSRFTAPAVTVSAGVPITFVLANDDPIEHEWIIGDEATHARHRTGTEPYHDQAPAEVSLSPYETRTTVVTFDTSGDYVYVCHLPGHEEYGMTGMIRVVTAPE